MHSTATPLPQTRIILHPGSVHLTEDLRSRTAERANRLLQGNQQIRQIVISLEQDAGGAPAHVVAKGEVMFDGPALLTSVTAASPAEAVDYLLGKLEAQLRRQRSPRHVWVSRRPPPPRGAATAPIPAATPGGPAIRAPHPFLER